MAERTFHFQTEFSFVPTGRISLSGRFELSATVHYDPDTGVVSVDWGIDESYTTVTRANGNLQTWPTALQQPQVIDLTREGWEAEDNLLLRDARRAAANAQIQVHDLTVENEELQQQYNQIDALAQYQDLELYHLRQQLPPPPPTPTELDPDESPRSAATIPFFPNN